MSQQGTYPRSRPDRLPLRLLHLALVAAVPTAAACLLVHHATTTGLLHMLEDGLMLAILCQVHLLNNIGQRQRPDLTFFNSFLIVFVTSFFAPDLWWSILLRSTGAPAGSCGSSRCATIRLAWTARARQVA